ncbi:MAG: hypothetical protein ACJ716_11400 [Marmoricola sp.]
MSAALKTALRVLVVGAVLLPVSGCGGGSHAVVSGGGCVSGYEPVAAAGSEQALKRLLLHDVDHKVATLKVLSFAPSGTRTADGTMTDARTVNLLDKRKHLVQSVDLWRKPDGTWVAQRWAQCID